MSLSKGQVEFLANLIPKVQRQVKIHGNKLYASVTLGQAIHESGWGTSKKMVAANALFGVKVGRHAYHYGNAWKGAAYKTGTTEYYDGVNPTKIQAFFRQYDSIEESICDYLDMLLYLDRYKGAVSQPTLRKSLEGIIAGGYATGPDYVAHVMKLVTDYNLTQYDSGLIIEVNPYHECKTVLKRGSKCMGVKYLQWELTHRGYNCGDIDGAFGPATEKAVKQYQKDHDLAVDGIVGNKTWSKLKEV